MIDHLKFIILRNRNELCINFLQTHPNNWKNFATFLALILDYIFFLIIVTYLSFGDGRSVVNPLQASLQKILLNERGGFAYATLYAISNF